MKKNSTIGIETPIYYVGLTGQGKVLLQIISRR
jgi:hypothetical protein